MYKLIMNHYLCEFHYNYVYTYVFIVIVCHNVTINIPIISYYS